MSLPGFIDLCSDDEEVTGTRDVIKSNMIIDKGPNAPSQTIFEEYHATRQGFYDYGIMSGLTSSDSVTELSSMHANRFSPISGSPRSVPICRQFWKAGDYEPGLHLAPKSRDGQNRLRVHPKFLHSNATSHKWAFGAIAELLDNAIDEVQNGATFVIIDKITDTRDGNPALLIQDDGGGMDPEALRHCMSFGFSDKQSDTSIGQYGNGFKTSTMRLGADVIVFTRCVNKRNITQSVGLLSYTFLRQSGYDDIVVPMVDYDYDPSTGVPKELLRHGQKQFYSNLSTLLRWTPFGTKDELLKQFADIGHHGTKIIMFNLWFNDSGQRELDFDTDLEDIMISGASKLMYDHTAKMFSPNHIVNRVKMLTQNHIANRLRYSLRVYSSILYLHLPESFKIVLRGRVVEPHCLVNDLRFRECIKYKPQVGLIMEPTIITTIGFLEGAPNLNIHGFNVYYRNRLILPFWPVVTNTHGKARGVAGVLEVNFVKPTHDKQDFEKSSLYQKLEIRLREMASEYWNYHCHLVGYQAKKRAPTGLSPTADPSPQLPHLGSINGVKQVILPTGVRSVTSNVAHLSEGAEGLANNSPHLLVSNEVVTALNASLRSAKDPASNSRLSARSQVVTSLPSAQKQSSNANISNHTEVPKKRRHEEHIDAVENSKKPAVTEITGVLGSNPKKQVEKHVRGRKIRQLITMIREHKKLQMQCLELEEVEKQFLLKEQKLRNELQEVQRVNEGLLAEIKLLDATKMEKL
ncbi:protein MICRORCHIDIA 6-like [Iris pallida]|uniref:Protein MICRORCHIDIA 6-like n=1 Tax=Iris pallida TaxID=29817 RepID=A0AAX6DZG4_IRIPA|nr:protein MICRORCHIDIA 6-like [Iris pallida]